MGSGWLQMFAPCHLGENQRWFFNRLSQGWQVQTIINGQIGCADGYAGHGAQVRHFWCDGTQEQQWVKSGNDSLFSLENVKFPGQCMDVEDWGRGTRVVLWDCHYGNNQLWRVQYS
jgi:hypothetical protein